MDTTTQDQSSSTELPTDAQQQMNQTIEQTLGTSPSGPTPTVAAQAEDDVIDKAWIAKAKQIILANSADPYAQSQQLAALKIEYLQKRYNKTVNSGS